MSKRRGLVFAVGALLIVSVLLLFWLLPGNENAPAAPRAKAPPVATSPRAPSAVGNPPSEIAAEPASHLADDLNVPFGTIRRDLEILNEVFATWQTNFPHDGNPVGENAEVTAALTGANPLHFAFIPKNHRAINARGELCDRWGTPFLFHQLSGTQMEIRSAGPDEKFGSADDVEFAPWPK